MQERLTETMDRIENSARLDELNLLAVWAIANRPITLTDLALYVSDRISTLCK